MNPLWLFAGIAIAILFGGDNDELSTVDGGKGKEGTTGAENTDADASKGKGKKRGVQETVVVKNFIGESPRRRRKQRATGNHSTGEQKPPKKESESQNGDS